MLDAISAETLKLRRHRATWFLVWIFPIGALVIPLLVILAQLAQNSPAAPGPPALDMWLENAADFWDLPRSGLGRLLIAAYVAVVFAGEYGWNTWKLIVPHRARASLIAAKYAVVLGLLYLAFFLAALLTMGMGWLEDVATGDPIPDGITFSALAAAHWTGFVATLPATLLTVALAGLAAILTRSTSATVVVGVVVVTIEQIFTAFGPGLSIYMPGPVQFLYQALPGYHLGNLVDWALDGAARVVPFPSGANVAWDWTGSLAVVGAWTAGLVALAFWRFQRQDIN